MRGVTTLFLKAGPGTSEGWMEWKRDDGGLIAGDIILDMWARDGGFGPTCGSAPCRGECFGFVALWENWGCCMRCGQLYTCLNGDKKADDG